MTLSFLDFSAGTAVSGAFEATLVAFLVAAFDYIDSKFVSISFNNLS